MGDLDIIEKAIERGLICGARIKGDLDAGGLSRGVVVDVEVGGFVEAMEERSRCRGVKVSVKVGVPIHNESWSVLLSIEEGCQGCAYTVVSVSSPGNGGIFDERTGAEHALECVTTRS